MLRDLRSPRVLYGGSAAYSILEDLQLADESTLDLLSALARRRVSARLMLLATYRPADVIM